MTAFHAKPALYAEPDPLAGTTPTTEPMPGKPPAPKADAPIMDDLLAKPFKSKVPLKDGCLVPDDFEGLQRLARMIYQSGMVPKGIDSEADACIVLAAGFEAGLSLGQTLKNVMIVNKRPTLWGDAALALCRRSPLCEGIKETIEGEGDKRVARCVCRRKGEPDPVERSFSVADAKKAKLWEKRGYEGKDTPWITNPDRMLQMRARGFALRDAFPDLLMGLGITEEALDIDGFDPSKMAGPSAALPDPT